MNDIENYQDYWSDVQRTARISLNEVSEHDEQNRGDRELRHEAARYSLDGNSTVDNYPRTVIYYTDAGFYGDGHDLYVRQVDFDDNDSMRMINALARAAYYNDIQDALDFLIERRESLGECMSLIGDHPIWDSGVVIEYEYEHGVLNSEASTYILECLGEGEWKMFNPQDEAFEVISPDVMVGDSDFPERALDIKLSNFCAHEMRERTGQ